MNTIKNIVKQAVSAGSCTGTVGNGVAFNASMVELTSKTFPLPHGEAHVMFARHRAPEPDFTTREINLSFTKELPADTYELTPESNEIRLSFADHSNPLKPVIYTQVSGTADLEFDDIAHVFKGTLKNVIVENNDDDNKKTLTINVEFIAKTNFSHSSYAYGTARAA